ncbi:DedA family protein [Mangrovivirga cuniculi]|uniref:Alkaline phosphatase n=1 Tax=Mangrovivirga cuniculi TaxID=2715131 RepID=A0A4D7JVR6_9BACT|nr:VTT domain-containing protein [Mangrovivirga cuniculi]QCK16622.1 alkaline phosphatase [Mangrovivirga cuniculi]
MGGLAIVIALTYVETGFLIGLVVPGGETLIFTTGVLASTGVFDISVYWIIPILIVSACLGDMTGYLIGRKLGPRLYKMNDRWYFKKRYLRKAEEFYQDKGAMALILGRFVPVIRTMNPLLSGAGKIRTKYFFLYVIIGVTIYIVALVLLGYFLGGQFPSIQDYLGYILPGLVLLLIAPVVIKYYRSKKKKKDSE